MSRAAIIRRWRAFRACEDGTTLTELAVALALFLLLLLGLLDFGRLAFHHVTAEKAMQIAARVAAVRPAACTGVPQIHVRGDAAPPARFGTSCGAGTGICAAAAEASCLGAATNATAAEIWGLVGSGLPHGTTIANLRFRYASDPNLGFLGGPYTPVVTVELEDVTFQFVSPLGTLVGLTGATPPNGLGGTIDFPAMSVSLPAEDLALGTNG